MRFPRSSGLLLHPTSLAGGHGIGDLGPAAYDFLAFLARSGQSLWQVLPIGPTGYGDSPYQTFSAFAGNPLLLSLDKLAADGLLERREIDSEPRPEGDVEFEEVLAHKGPLLRKAAKAFQQGGAMEVKASWLEDFALFMALKEAHGMRPWPDWPAELRDRDPEALARARRELADEIAVHKALQSLFFDHWTALREA